MASTTFNSLFEVRFNSAAETLVRNWWLFTLRGVLGIVFGLIALIFPGPTILSLVILFSAYMLVDGVFGIISAVRAIRRKGDRWGLLIFEGLVNIAVGIAAFLWPGLTVVAFMWLIAAWAIVTGGLMTAAGFRLNIDHGRWWLILGGLLSLAFGVLLIITPLIGAIVLTWWLGAYAILFGVALVIFSFKLRSRQHELASPTAVGTAA
jgi:uncharacterized membrane protein HdeD (DUF308 family)